MKKVLGVLFALFLCANVFSQGIDFQHVSFDEALAKAKKENKMVFMDCYTTWCGPCKALAKNVFPQKEVGDYFNSNFVCIKMDMEKGEGPALLKKYEIIGFPTLLYLAADGKVISKRIGGTDAAGLIADGKTAGDPTETLEYSQKKYQEGDRSKELVTKYISLLQKNYVREELNKVGNEYLKTLSNEDLMDADNFKVFSGLGTSYESEKFQYILKNKEQFCAKAGEEQVNQLIQYTTVGYLPKLAVGSDFEKFETFVANYNKSYPDPRNEGYFAGLYLDFYKTNKQFDKWFEAVELQLKKAEATDKEMYSKTLIRFAFSIAGDPVFSESKGAYGKAFTWVNKAVDLDANAEGADMCMAMLYKQTGEKEKALKSLEVYKEKNSPFSARMEGQYNFVKGDIEKM